MLLPFAQSTLTTPAQYTGMYVVVRTALPALGIVPPTARFLEMLRFVTLRLEAVRVPREHVLLPDDVILSDTLSEAPDIAPSCVIVAFGGLCPTYEVPFMQVRF